MNKKVDELIPPSNAVNAFVDEHRFYILGVFNDELKKEIIIPFTRRIFEYSKLREPAIDFYINSPGGDGMLVMHLIQLFEQAKAKGIIVRTIVPAFAYSAGSMLAVAGSNGERYISHVAEHLIHYGSISDSIKSTPLQVDREAAHEKRWFNAVLNHYKKYSKVPKLDERIKDNNFFIPADKCIKWGLADKYMEDIK
jgi:ATP-dependent protease ClpP protease subunit